MQAPVAAEDTEAEEKGGEVAEPQPEVEANKS
jgi:hypothetical protein